VVAGAEVFDGYSDDTVEVRINFADFGLQFAPENGFLVVGRGLRAARWQRLGNSDCHQKRQEEQCSA